MTTLRSCQTLNVAVSLGPFPQVLKETRNNRFLHLFNSTSITCDS